MTLNVNVTPQGGLALADYTNLLRRQPPLPILLALRQIVLVEGAVLLYAAEKAGLARPTVLRAAERRIAELEGTEPDQPPTLELGGVAVDPDMRKWEETHDTKIKA